MKKFRGIIDMVLGEDYYSFTSMRRCPRKGGERGCTTRGLGNRTSNVASMRNTVKYSEGGK
jgi:hypothetical protein